MKFSKLILPIIFVAFVLLLAGCFGKKTAVSHPDINVITPKSGETIRSPFLIEGQAKGTWYFEADFPIFLIDEKGNEVAIVIAQAQSDWMTEDFVPFKAELKLNIPKKMKATLVFKKDNPSGLPEYEDEFRLPVVISDK